MRRWTALVSGGLIAGAAIHVAVARAGATPSPLPGCAVWSLVPAPIQPAGLATQSRAPQYFSARLEDLRGILEKATETQAVRLCVPLPSTSGHYLEFEVKRSPVARVPSDFKYVPYKATRIAYPSDYARFTLGPDGLDGLIISPTGITVIEPGANGAYVFSYRSDMKWDPATICPRIANGDIGGLAPMSQAWPTLSLTIAPYISHDYASLHAGATDRTLGRVLTSLNIVSGILEHEANVELRPLLERSLIDTGPIKGVDESQRFIDTAVGGTSHYDLGHRLLGSGSAGVSASNVCDPKTKAHAESQQTGSHLNIELLAHEIAHQLGATHTFSGSGFPANRSRGTAYEPGNGSSLLSYAGVPGGHHLQVKRRDYYLLPQTIHQIRSRLLQTGCPTRTIAAPANNLPRVTVANPRWQVPKATPFTLTANVSDQDGEDDLVTVRWEGDNTGALADEVPPIFRARWRGNGAVRSFPAPDFAGSFSPPLGEERPDREMDLRFMVFARDRRFGVGRNKVEVKVLGCGPFKALGPADVGANRKLSIKWESGCEGEANRRIRISLLLGGSENPDEIQLHGGVPNKDRAFETTISIPGLTAPTEARVKLEAVGHIYYAMSPSFTIKP